MRSDILMREEIAPCTTRVITLLTVNSAAEIIIVGFLYISGNTEERT